MLNFHMVDSNAEQKNFQQLEKKLGPLSVKKLDRLTSSFLTII